MRKKLFFILVLFLLSGSVFFSCRKERSCEGCINGNKPPIANAGRDTIIVLPQDSATLDGSASYDPDGSIGGYVWSKISGPPSFLIINPQSVRTIIKNLTLGVYQFGLTVTDNGGLSAKDTIMITVHGVTINNHPPIANAGADQTITLPTNTVNLNGSGSSDPDNNITGYIWTKISGPATFNISNGAAVQTQATSLAQGVYQFELKVTDAGGLLSRDTMQVTVNPPLLCGSNRPEVNATLVPVGILSKPRANMAVASAGNKILFAGGTSDASPSELWGSSRVDIYDIAANTWSTAELSVARYGIAAIASGNKIFFAGGSSGEIGDVTETYHTTVDIYDVATNTWSVGNLSEHVAFTTAATVGNKVFFAGGYGTITTGPITFYGYVSNKVDIYDLTTNIWSTTLLSESKYGISAVTLNDKIYFAGGSNFSSYFSNKIDIYDGVSNSWSTSTLSEPKTNLAGIAVANKIYWAGGGNNQGALCKVEIRDGTTQTTSFDYLSYPAFVTAVLKDNKIVYDRDWNVKFDLYDLTTNTWSIGVKPTTRPSASIISVNNTIYIAGGFLNGGNNFSNEVWKLEF